MIREWGRAVQMRTIEHDMRKMDIRLVGSLVRKLHFRHVSRFWQLFRISSPSPHWLVLLLFPCSRTHTLQIFSKEELEIFWDECPNDADWIHCKVAMDFYDLAKLKTFNLRTLNSKTQSVLSPSIAKNNLVFLVIPSLPSMIPIVSKFYTSKKQKKEQ